MTRVVVAIGGNALIEDPTKPEIQYQWEAMRKTCTHIADMIAWGWEVVVTHGNGPQVGHMLRRSELAAEEVYTLPLDMIVASTQGMIGYMVQQTLENEFRRRQLDRRAVTVVTQTQVDPTDQAFRRPSKPIGAFLTEAQAAAFRKEGWHIIEDSGRGLRRVTASPSPRHLVEYGAVHTLLEAGFVVVASGGGGIPVTQTPAGDLQGLYAVIDKDRSAALLARSLHADLLLISTAVDQVALNFNTPAQRWLPHMTLNEARDYAKEGHFGQGSMAPKVEAAIAFVGAGGPAALITSPSKIAEALAGRSGTWVTIGPAGGLSEVLRGLRGTIEEETL